MDVKTTFLVENLEKQYHGSRVHAMCCDPSLDSQPRDLVNVGIKLKNTPKIWKIVK
jgi:hypothetical protein